MRQLALNLRDLGFKLSDLLFKPVPHISHLPSARIYAANRRGLSHASYSYVVIQSGPGEPTRFQKQNDPYVAPHVFPGPERYWHQHGRRTTSVERVRRAAKPSVPPAPTVPKTEAALEDARQAETRTSSRRVIQCPHGRLREPSLFLDKPATTQLAEDSASPGRAARLASLRFGRGPRPERHTSDRCRLPSTFSTSSQPRAARAPRTPILVFFGLAPRAGPCRRGPLRLAEPCVQPLHCLHHHDGLGNPADDYSEFPPACGLRTGTGPSTGPAARRRRQGSTPS